MSRLELNCEYSAETGGACVRDTYLELLDRLRILYGPDNVSGGPVTSLDRCLKRQLEKGILCEGQCGARAVLFSVRF